MHATQIEFFMQIDRTIEEINTNNENTINATKKVVEYLGEKINELRQALSNHHFHSVTDEIQFFKEQKPRLMAQLIHYNLILEIEANMPLTKKEKIKFFEMMLSEISLFIQRNKLFYQYYRSGSTHYDEKYFTRNRSKTLSYDQTHAINFDIRFCTSHDYNVAQFMANEMIVEHLENKLEQIKNNALVKNNQQALSKLSWSANKIDLVEVIYALYHQKVISNGTIEIKELSKAFEQFFNITIDDNIYRYYTDIKNRKGKRSKFIDVLSENLNTQLSKEDL